MIVDIMNLLLILVYATHVVWAQNVDFYHELSVEEFKPPEPVSENSLFGYSTTYDPYNKQLIISAPRGSSIGEVYQCNMTSGHACSKLGYDIKRVAPGYDHNYWFGASVKAGSSFVVACAPGYTAQSDSYDYGMYGHCYKRIKHADKFTTVMVPWKKTLSSNLGIEQDMNTLGWSLDVGVDDSIIVGGPAMYLEKGLAALWPPKSKNRMLQRITEIDAELNFGYSVAVGNFLSEYSLSYAVGSTYGEKGYGKVYLYTFNSGRIEYLSKLDKGEDNDVVGSMYGAVLCAAKIINKGKATDLLVGAPTFAFKSSVNAGAVYVYIYSKTKNQPQYKRRLSNQKDSSFFGSAIVSVGDLNGDEKDEIAIGAPYEDDGRGAVYLYSGADLLSDKTEKTLTWLQRLEPKYKSFGLNLAALKDFDDNGCNELAVSSPYENRVLLYRCMAAVTITKLYAEFPNLQNRTHSRRTDFIFKVCMDVKYPPKPENIIAQVYTEVELNHLSAKLTAPTKNNIFTFETSFDKKKPQYCNDVSLTLPSDGIYKTKIGYKISTKLLNSPVNMHIFNSPRVILSDNSTLLYQGSVWAAECASEKGCISNLSLTMSTNMSHPFHTGSSERATFKVVVLNTGEVAYDPCIEFKVKGAVLYQPPMDCSKDLFDQMWECTSRKPVKTNEPWPINDFIVDLKGLTNIDQDVTFSVNLYDRCEDKYNKKPYSLTIPLKSSEDFDIKGRTNIGEIVNMTKKDVYYDGKGIEHVYTIVNNGPTNFVNLTTKVKLQKENYIKYLKVPVSYYRETDSLSQKDHSECKITTEHDSELVVECSIGSLRKQHFVKVVIAMSILPGTLNNILQTQNVTVNSSIILEAAHLYKTERISTLIQLQEAFVDLWVIILACLFGLLLIFILVVVLFKIGFLRRKNKEDLEELKRSVNRQSMRRSMMRQSQVEDRRPVLERMDELDETVGESTPPSKS